MTSVGRPDGRRRGLILDEIRWHILREDQHRAGVSARANSVLSTNALVVAGTALAFTVKGASRPSVAMICLALVVLLFVAASVVNAAMALVSSHALITPERWVKSWDQLHTEVSRVYAYPYYSAEWSSFEQFYDVVANASPEQQLRGAAIELWIGASIDRHRYGKLRVAIRCLIMAIGFLGGTVGVGIVGR
ncbi:hypothetical protein [Nocardia sp. NPDC048505]|uniref:hypothetical protein n=1 Tax=unclassified Nocardia TaxID=2637762 RepID=UPI0033EA916F